MSDAMQSRVALPVYLPDNEPYLGRELLLAFDRSIPAALEVHTSVAKPTFESSLSPLQVAATEIIPQGVSIALSIRELVRQASVLRRHSDSALVERTGTIRYLQRHPEAVEAWRSGWPRQAQPTLQVLLDLLHPGRVQADYDALRTLMNKLVHSDLGSVYNMLRRSDGVPVFASGKVLDSPQLCDAVCAAGWCYLKMLSAIAIFPVNDPTSR